MRCSVGTQASALAIVASVILAGCSGDGSDDDWPTPTPPSDARLGPSAPAIDQTPTSDPPLPEATPPTDDSTTATPPPPSAIEARYIQALEEAGASDVGVAQLGFREAILGGTFEGRYIQLHAYPAPYPTIPGAEETAALDLGVLEAQVWQIHGTGEAIRLTCGRDVVQVASLDADLSSDSSTVEHTEPIARAIAESTCG